ncbi:UDP-3-O-(3-hydroxymyristoyl)glucosamine N-acyltransferase [Porticoccus sp. W117]|uniref:UDP-3-O-(3-hydroxymyristoyl)glucosamine N-acyltransferase n=1 Tax=Porticoccus sp. W117 TaxID=3054777 RepID=UPI00259237F1|nr:UDP-3-O-(3-hydroxymyristoyl)glucosamine N-acyltransferase [Porticoccus sp. W117]MDM3870272.1 UDP-3-O-(3-hydroxymyristoyl)glucosamine N-acyltransferase [Porticoccus sp. W117]
MPQQMTLGELAQQLGAELRGDAACQVHSLATLQEATEGQISFLANPAYERFLETTEASAVILSPKMADKYSGNALLLDNPYLGYAHLSKLLDNAPKADLGIHPSAVVAASAQLHPSVSVAANVVIGEGVVIGADTAIGTGTAIGDNTRIGEGCQLAANVTVYHGVSMGNQVTIHSGAVIGADGFGFAPDADGNWVKIHQLGGVVIGNRVEIGANTTIDRGALGNTEIADGVIIDNQVMIAHNVKVGENTAMAAFTGISGSTTIGKNCTWAGRSGAVGHIDIGDNVHVAGTAVMMKSVDEPGAYGAGTPTSPIREWRRNSARFNQLDEMSKRLRRLEKQLAENEK